MGRRAFFTLIILTALISAGATLAVLSVVNPGPTVIREQVTFQFVITNTPNPNPAVFIVGQVFGVTPGGDGSYRLITATPQPGEIARVTLPADLLETQDLTRSPVPTLDTTSIVPNSDAERTVTALPENCILHVVQENDTPFGIAELYAADPFALLAVNGLTEETSVGLQIGQVLIVPLEGCPLQPPAASETPSGTLTPTPTVTPTGASPTPAVTFTPSNTPTITLQPTASNAQIQIVEVVRPGDVTAEAVRIRNIGNAINVTGWELSDSQGNVYTFPEQFIFSNAEISVYTRAGQNTPVAFFWGRDEAVWGESGDTLTLTDADGEVQASLRLEQRP